ncbi:histone deacetylase 7-like [Parus major]|uniref:histone deacetylase 7-like n=1 Tax=Parus major TaxID=9157 RepID=UPI001443A189|nr:histone deacetylase 7-like [Parus major]
MPSVAAVTPCTSPRVPQAVPMDLRIGQRVVKPQDTALLALKQQQLQHQLFLASLHQQQVEQLAHQHVRVRHGAGGTPTPHFWHGLGQDRALGKVNFAHSAVASTVVKQKLAEVILKKQQAALERTSNAPAAALPYRSLEPLEPEGPSPAMLSTFLSPVASASLDPPEHFPLRKTASEPNLKVRCKPRKCLDRRKNPLTRKESAPPSLKRRPPEAIGEEGPGSLCHLCAVPGVPVSPLCARGSCVTSTPRGHGSASRLPPEMCRPLLAPRAGPCHLPLALSPWLQRMAKSSEKPRLRQIPSSEDMEAEGTLPEAAAEGGDPGRARLEPPRPGSSGKEPERTQKMGQPQEELVLQQALLWDSFQRVQQQLLKRQPLADPPVVPPGHRPLSRAQSSPATASASLPAQDTKALALPVQEPQPHFTTGLVYDSVMLKHQCSCGDNSNHPEHAGRIQSIWSRLQERGLRSRWFSGGPKAPGLPSWGCLMEVLDQSCSWSLGRPMSPLQVDSDTIWNELHSSNAARWAAGSVTELAFKVATRELKNGFAVVRPPGHHADPSTAMGFCFFNSVAIAARQLQQKGKLSKILIVDWDVHHGNGTQQIFYRDPEVLYISLHRHDDGNFFPGSGAADEVRGDQGDQGDSGTRLKVTMRCPPKFSERPPHVPSCPPVSPGATIPVSPRVPPQPEPLPEESVRQKPNANAVRSLEAVIQVQSKYWVAVQRFASKLGCSFLEAQHHEADEVETVTALASLSVAVMVEKRAQEEPMEQEEPMNQ